MLQNCTRHISLGVELLRLLSLGIFNQVLDIIQKLLTLSPILYASDEG